MIRGLVTAALMVCIGTAGTAQAHEVRPAYLRVVDLADSNGPGFYEVLWRLPTGSEIPLTLHVILPDHCQSNAEPASWQENGVRISRWTTYCPGGLAGHEILIGDLAASVTDVLARFERTNGTTQVNRLTPTSTRFLVTESERPGEVVQTYLLLGVEHILLGIDHLLFVFALLLIVSGGRRLVATVTAFTLAHSVTLAAATLGWVQVPQQPVEAVIALSILFVATEIVHWRRGRARGRELESLTRRKPWLVAFAFGLLHGFGFAGALSEIGLPEHAIPLALLFFNLGVEVGQLSFIAAVYLLWWPLRNRAFPEWAWQLPVYGIGTMAGFWTIERIAGFLPGV